MDFCGEPGLPFVVFAVVISAVFTNLLQAFYNVKYPMDAEVQEVAYMEGIQLTLERNFLSKGR